MRKYALRLRMLSGHWIWSVIVMLALSSCRVQAVTSSVNSTDSVRQCVAQLRVDSVYVRDSIYIRERGDTVFVDRWHVRWKERAATKADTVYVESRELKIESRKAHPERYVPKFYKWCTGILCGLVTATILWLLWRIVKLIYLKKRLSQR